jgi:alkylation response protein AidB-like acyl-CoA dehydrogenase
MSDEFDGDGELFRQQVRDWIEANAPDGLVDVLDWNVRADLPGSVSSRQSEEQVLTAQQDPLFKEWEKRCLDAGLVCPAWPEEHGGRGWGPVRMTVLDEEFYRARVPRIDRLQGETMVGPSIILHGTAEQQEYFLPRIRSGEHRYCQGFSEPSAGSDLASARTRGVIEGDSVVMTGQTVWTSRHKSANMIFVLCRTDQDAPQHRGLSYVIAEFVASNGIEVRPIRQITGSEEFAEVFLDGARAPLTNVIGGLGGGWKVVQSTLNFERGASGRASSLLRLAREEEFWALVDEVRARGLDKDPVVRQQLAWAYSQVEIMRYTWHRTNSEFEAGREPGRQVSTWKLFWSEYHTRFADMAMGILGTSQMARAEGADQPLTRWQDAMLTSRSGTIYAGTSEVQRNILGERVLGLPREPR